MEQFYKIKGWAFPIAMGTIMPIVMPLAQGQPIEFPGILLDIVVFNTIALLIARMIVNIPKMNEKFLDLLHIKSRNFFTLIIEQIPTAVIFSTIMGYTATLLHVRMLSWGIFMDFLAELPFDILISIGVQVVVELVLNIIVKPIVVKTSAS